VGWLVLERFGNTTGRSNVVRCQELEKLKIEAYQAYVRV